MREHVEPILRRAASANNHNHTKRKREAPTPREEAGAQHGGEWRREQEDLREEEGLGEGKGKEEVPLPARCTYPP